MEQRFGIRYGAIAAILAAVVTQASAAGAVQNPPAPSYTVLQAHHGQTLYYEQCAECHGGMLEGQIGPALAGGDGNVQWETVSYVWTYVTAHMPAGNAGGLSLSDYADILAFLLQEHGHVPGRARLTPKIAMESEAYFGL
ncbi:MAG TPA: c-type cytochrome [Candidatus Acidoferrales bacterium]|nr:c-type cytochrome [Candidatus Acidoferrales bacterium]